MRIITGSARGCRLKTLEGDATRPTLEKAKEMVFSSIQFDLEGRFVLDLFAGSGQIGLEALSRGAEKCVFCDISEDAVTVIKENAQKTKLYQKCGVFRSDFRDYLRAASVSKHKFNIVFLDPPYGQGMLAEALLLLHKYSVLAEGAIILCEEESEEALALSDGLEEIYTVEKQYKCGRIYYNRLILK